MKKLWIIPLILLISLGVAWHFRWEYQASKTDDEYVFRWKLDRWTNKRWIEVYAVSSKQLTAIDVPANIDLTAPEKITKLKDKEWEIRNRWTVYWKIAVGICFLWLVASLVYPQIKNKEQNPG